MTDWEKTRLTTAEQEDALRRADVPIDPLAWEEGDLQRAKRAFAAASAAKLAFWRLCSYCGIPTPCGCQASRENIARIQGG